MDKKQRQTVVVKLSMVWDANPKYSLVELLEKLSGRGRVGYVRHSYAQGQTANIEALERPISLTGWTDGELEEVLDGFL